MRMSKYHEITTLKLLAIFRIHSQNFIGNETRKAGVQFGAWGFMQW